MMVVAHGAEYPTTREQPSRPSKQTNDDDEVNEGVNGKKANNFRGGTTKTSRKITKNDSNKTIVTKPRLPTGPLSSEKNSSRCNPSFNRFGTDTLAESNLYNAKHRVKLSESNAKPVLFATYRVGTKAREVAKNENNKILLERVIEPSQTDWAALIVFAPKKNVSLRFSVDDRKLNAFTKRDVYPILLIKELIDLLVEATVFVRLDSDSGYWHAQVQIKG